MTEYAPYRLVARLDPLLGDPHEADSPFSFAGCLALDEREEFPTEICGWLDGLGLPAYYVPARYGGAAATFEDTLQVIRVLARRDLGVAISHAKTFLGAASAWVVGDDDRARWLAGRILGGSVVAWCLTEEAHGSDLLACDTAATPIPDGYRLTGAKWLINNATRADVVCVFARTDPAGGTRGFSLLLVDKGRLPPASYECIPRARTHGMRNAEISGITFKDATVPADALLGRTGGGLETVVKTLQLTKILSAVPLSLGAGDRALRLALDAGAVSRTLTRAYADQLVAEVLGIVAARAVHATTGELSVVAAAVKYYLPTSVDRMIGSLGGVLGGAAVVQDGTFQKVERDHRVVGIFDGNTLVNLNAIINQFPALANGYRAGLIDHDGLRSLLDLTVAVPRFTGSRLSLIARHGCSLVQNLPHAVDELRKLAAEALVPAGLEARATRLAEVADELHDQLAAYRPSARDVPATAFALARRYVLCFAAAACLQVWLRNATPAEGSGLWADGLWLDACLTRLLRELSPGSEREDDGVFARLGDQLVHQYRENLLFSPFRCQLGFS